MPTSFHLFDSNRALHTKTDVRGVIKKTVSLLPPELYGRVKSRLVEINETDRAWVFFHRDSHDALDKLVTRFTDRVSD